MKTNLETFPTPSIEIEQMCYEELHEYLSEITFWLVNFKKELQQQNPIITCPVCPKTGCPLKKEILGE